jgi:hypothetical protein
MKYTIKEYINKKILYNTPGKALLNVILIVALLVTAFYIGSTIFVFLMVPLLFIVALVISLLFIAGLCTAILSPFIIMVYLCRKPRKKTVQTDERNDIIKP